MSSRAVREAFRTQVAALLQPAFAYVESVNVATQSKALPARWYTLDFLAADDARMSLGRPTLFRESGSVVVMIFTEQQIGDAEGTTAADTVRAALCNWDALNGALRVLQCAPPSDMDGGDIRGAWYALSIDTRYQFDRLAD